MLQYINSQVFGQQNKFKSLSSIDRLIDQFENDRKRLQQQIGEYESRIEKLPIQIRKRIIQLQNEHAEFNLQIPEQGSPSPKLSNKSGLQKDNIKVDKATLQKRLENLKEQQSQIQYISKLSDMYIRCKKQSQTTLMVNQLNDDLNESKNAFTHQKFFIEQEEMQNTSQFIQQIKPYVSKSSTDELQDFLIINQLIANIRTHTTKKLTEKCQNLVHCDLTNKGDKITIETYLIINCKSIILQQSDQASLQQKNIKIINKFIQRILTNVIYYDVSYQKIVLLEVKNEQQKSGNKHHQVIKRQKLSFLPAQTDKYFQNLKFTIDYHVQKVQELRGLLFEDSQSHNLDLMNEFDKIVDRYTSTIKSTLEYILPYLNIKSRKELMKILSHGKDEKISFQDLVLRLKFKGQDGDMFMTNLDAVFNRLFQIKKDQSKNQQKIKFNDKNFDILTSFFELGIFEAEQSLLETSSKAIMKFTTNLSRKLHDKSGQQNLSKYKSKKLFNMIFFSVSNLIQRFDVLLDQKSHLFDTYCEDLQQTYQEKVSQWTLKLITIRERLRVKIHEE